MKNNYKRLGNYIKKVNVRNTENLELPLMGLTIDKKFIPSVANTIGTDLTKYKVVYKNQFACSLMQVSRDGKMPIARLDDEAVIMSPAYPIFKVTQPEVLLPEYLEMWFKREEFDREAAFYAVGGVRGNLTWEDFCDLTLPIPSIEKQREIVADYQAVENKIKTNEAICEKLEETAQTIYRRWFEEFEFPNKEGKPYKSNGGEMVYNEELEKEVPKGWEVKSLGDICLKITKGTTPKAMSVIKTEQDCITYIKGESINDNHTLNLNNFSFISDTTNNKLKRSQIQKMDICYSIAGTLDKWSIIDDEILPANCNQAISIIRLDEKIVNRYYIFGLFYSGWQKEYYRFNIQQAVQANLSLTTISSLPILIPPKSIENKIGIYFKNIFYQLLSYEKENRRLHQLQSLLLGRMTREEK